MQYNFVFYIIVAILIFDFVAECLLDFLNAKWRSKPVPTELNDIYNNERYEKQQNYSKVNARFGLLTATVSFMVMLVFLLLKGFGWLHYTISPHFDSELMTGLVFFGVLFFASDVLTTPFSVYDTFVIEERFGFNKSTPKIYIIDKLKGYLVSMIIGGIIYAIFYKFYIWWPNMFWVYVWIFMALFTIFMAMFYSNLIVPLFNKQTPLPDGELKTAIKQFGEKVGFKIKDVYQIDGSKRSTRANAYFTGLGAKKRIVLYDTLIDELSTEELVAVLAHEIGHYKKKHTLTSMVLSIIQLGIMLYILSVFISHPSLSEALGVDQPVFYIGLLAFALLYSPISTITGLLMNIYSRKNEYEADNFAASNYSSGHLVTALKKLTSNNLSNLTPHPIFVFVNYSHPPLLQRIKNLKKH